MSFLGERKKWLSEDKPADKRVRMLFPSALHMHFCKCAASPFRDMQGRLASPAYLYSTEPLYRLTGTGVFICQGKLIGNYCHLP
ncbi:hypothetical protein DV515_00004179 [Chloebia gouldiae]|uniref:Uncharacterized protein n=1 Tax=Chloebia gouldiae TaxID=44316 RepID=A0A3L8SUA2_CHLGU|nr:hypothetical protein DV515_00004179 [Chloebia gouldiae]